MGCRLLEISSILVLFVAFALCDGNSHLPPPSPPLAPFPFVSVHATKGRRKEMEDFSFVSRDGRFCVVCDGHGGAAVSKYVRDNLYANFLALLPEARPWKNGDVARAFRAAVSKVDDEVVGIRKWQRQGSTCAAVHLNCPDGDGDGDGEGDDPQSSSILITTANVGDSRIVLGRGGKATELTTDHKPEHRGEKARVAKLGGTVTWHGLTRNNRPVRGSGVYRVNRNLSLSRAIGDLVERPCITAEPDIRQYVLPVPQSPLPATGSRDGTTPGCDDDEPVLILATDGLWDVFTSLEAVTFVRDTYRSIQTAALATAADATSGTQEAGKGLLGQDKGALPKDDVFLRAKARLRDMDLPPLSAAADAYEALQKTRQRMARCLVAEALRRGSTDNITVIVQWIRRGRRDNVR